MLTFVGKLYWIVNIFVFRNVAIDSNILDILDFDYLRLELTESIKIESRNFDFFQPR